MFDVRIIFRTIAWMLGGKGWNPASKFVPKAKATQVEDVPRKAA
ncbi:MAG: hypothetical protein ACI8X5_001151 [Planctomycetota bacterium]|jgi:hypothetical protein